MLNILNYYFLEEKLLQAGFVELSKYIPTPQKFVVFTQLLSYKI